MTITLTTTERHHAAPGTVVRLGAGPLYRVVDTPTEFRMRLERLSWPHTVAWHLGGWWYRVVRWLRT